MKTTPISLIESMVNQSVKPDVIYGETLNIDTDGREIGMRRLSAPDMLKWKKNSLMGWWYAINQLLLSVRLPHFTIQN